MTEFFPPMSNRETDELIEIANSESGWQSDAITLAKAELINRNISKEQQDLFFEKRTQEIDDYFEKIEEKRIANEVEKYTIAEMLLIIIFAPLYLSRIWYTFLDLRGENYKIKLRQHLILLSIGSTIWFIFFYFEFTNYQKIELEKPPRY